MTRSGGDEEPRTLRDLLGDALHDEGLGCDVRPNDHGVEVDWADHDGDAAHLIGRMNAATPPSPAVERGGLRGDIAVIRSLLANAGYKATIAVDRDRLDHTMAGAACRRRTVLPYPAAILYPSHKVPKREAMEAMQRALG